MSESERQLNGLERQVNWLFAETVEWRARPESPERTRALRELRGRNGQLDRELKRWLAEQNR